MKKIAEFYKNEGARLLAFIRSRTGSLEDAEDILGEVFLKTLEAPNVIAPIMARKRYAFLALRKRLAEIKITIDSGGMK